MRKVTFCPVAGADEVTIETNLPTSRVEAEKCFTPDELWDQAEANIDVKAQAIMRAHFKKLANGKESKLPTNWVNAVKYKERLSKIAKLRMMMADLSPEEKKALLSEETAKGKGK